MLHSATDVRVWCAIRAAQLLGGPPRVPRTSSRSSTLEVQSGIWLPHVVASPHPDAAAREHAPALRGSGPGRYPPRIRSAGRSMWTAETEHLLGAFLHPRGRARRPRPAAQLSPLTSRTWTFPSAMLCAGTCVAAVARPSTPQGTIPTSVCHGEGGAGRHRGRW